MTRQRQAIGLPPTGKGALTGFPRWPLAADRPLYRAHGVRNGPWWFASAHGNAGDGRFDLPDPDGTCYLASNEAVAIRERWGRNLVRRGYLMAADADATRVSQLTLPTRRRRLADTVHRAAANLGVTREIGDMTPYAIPQAWAAAFKRIGCGGVRYAARHSTGARDLAYALFGDAGMRTWPGDPAPATGRAAAHRDSIRVLDPPTRVHVAGPPHP